MPVMERTKIALPPEAVNLPTVEYPPEVIDRWNKQFDIMEHKLAIGEIVPKTVEDLAAELGIKLP